MILVREADIFLSESLRILAERLSKSENGLPLRQICYYSPPEDVGVFSTEIKNAGQEAFLRVKEKAQKNNEMEKMLADAMETINGIVNVEKKEKFVQQIIVMADIAKMG